MVRVSFTFHRFINCAWGIGGGGGEGTENKVSKWILTSYRPHTVTSGRPTAVASQSTLPNSSHLCQITPRSDHEANPNTNTKRETPATVKRAHTPRSSHRKTNTTKTRANRSNSRNRNHQQALNVAEAKGQVFKKKFFKREIERGKKRRRKKKEKEIHTRR